MTHRGPDNVASWHARQPHKTAGMWSCSCMTATWFHDTADTWPCSYTTATWHCSFLTMQLHDSHMTLQACGHAAARQPHVTADTWPCNCTTAAWHCRHVTMQLHDSHTTLQARDWEIKRGSKFCDDVRTEIVKRVLMGKRIKTANSDFQTTASLAYHCLSHFPRLPLPPPRCPFPLPSLTTPSYK